MYSYAVPVFCWLIQHISASPTLRPVSNVRTRPHLAPRVDPFDYGDGRRRPNDPVYDDSHGGEQPVAQIPNSGDGDGDPQSGVLFDVTQLSQGIGEGSVHQGWAWGPDTNWHDPQYNPTYGYTPLPNMLMSPQEVVFDNPVMVEAPSPIRSRSTRSAVSKRGQRLQPGDEGYAQYKRRQTQNRVNQRNYRIREAAKKELERLEASKEIDDEKRIEAIEKESSVLRGTTLASWHSDPPSEQDRAIYAEMDYQRTLPQYAGSGVEVPVAEPDGGYYDIEDAESLEWPDLGSSSIYGQWDPRSGPPGASRKLVRSQQYNSDGGMRHETSLRTRETPSSDPTAELAFYINVYTQLRSNVSSLLFPYFSNILSHMNSTFMYEMLHSVHSDLVAAGPWTIGPYSNGADCFDWIEYQLFGNITNSTLQNNDTVLGVLAANSNLIEMYSDVWGNASQIANQTGYLSQMSTVRRYLNPTNTSLLPEAWKTAQPLPKSLDFKALYGRYNTTKVSRL